VIIVMGMRMMIVLMMIPTPKFCPEFLLIFIFFLQNNDVRDRGNQEEDCRKASLHHFEGVLPFLCESQGGTEKLQDQTGVH